MKFKRGTCGANYRLMSFVAIETPICSKETPCETGKGHCDTNESCLSGNCGLKNCPTVDTILRPRSNLFNCCFEGTYCFFFNYSHATHCYFARLNLRKMGHFQFYSPVFLGINRHPKQKEFLNFCEGFLRAALTGHSHPSPF